MLLDRFGGGGEVAIRWSCPWVTPSMWPGVGTERGAKADYRYTRSPVTQEKRGDLGRGQKQDKNKQTLTIWLKKK